LKALDWLKSIEAIEVTLASCQPLCTQGEVGDDSGSIFQPLSNGDIFEGIRATMEVLFRYFAILLFAHGHVLLSSERWSSPNEGRT